LINSPKKNEMILITGATGFLGSELVHQLTSQGKQVRALRRKHSAIPCLIQNNAMIDWYTADILDLSNLEDAFEGIDKVYHCAAFISFNPKDKKKLIDINIEGTSNIVNLCLANNTRLLHVSSVAALGNAKKGNLITENDFWEYDAKAHSYAISKYEGEMEVWRGIAEGLDALIVNPSVIIGANSGFSGSGAIFKLIKEGLSYYTKGATGVVDVEDVAKSMIILMESSYTGERYTISAENYHYEAFFKEIAYGFGVKPPTKEATPWMLGIAWRAAKVASLFTSSAPALTKHAASSSLNESLYSNDKIKLRTGIQFKPLSQSIKETCEALKKI
jgi:dihydroflavonol-4-reductase